MENGKYQYDLVSRLSFTRFGGTDDELRAAKLLMDEIDSAGGHGEYMEFKIPAYVTERCCVRTAATFEKELEVVPYWLSGELPEGGRDLKFLYAERGLEEDYAGIGDLSDYAVMINELNFDAYKLLCKKHAGAFITISGKYYDTGENADLVPRAIRPKMLECGKVPGFSMRARDAMELVRDGAEMLHLELRGREEEHTSRDILAVIEGTEVTDESVVLTAHYDSVLVGTGSWDNATGAATLMYLYRYFIKNPPRRTMRFVWCGSEEQGLYGSKAYIEQHEELVKNEIKFCFNFDMCGTILGPNKIFITGGDDLKIMTEQLCREMGFSALLLTIVHSSDSAPFCDRGIPAIGISRGTSTAELHTRNDLMFPLCAEQLKNTADFAVKYISRIVNSVILPVKTGMPDNMKKELDKYFQRDKKPIEEPEGK
ncbi:MAG: M28 family metallopeptidase [Oscillospiraceae bacterium]